MMTAGQAGPTSQGAQPGGIIEARDLSRTYATTDGRTVAAVASATFSIQSGEFICVLGPSGCGKSTLLMMVSGLLAPSSGEIRFGEAAARGGGPRFGIVFQEAVLFPWRTVLANAALPLEVRKAGTAVRTAKAREMLRLVGLGDFESKYPHELSGGMQQRVAIARALTLDPSILLMDEPFGALDAMTREQMNLEIQRISLESGATVIFVTHSILEAAFLADRVFVMSGRPSTVRHIVPIDIPRPRRLEMMTSDRLGGYVTELRRCLEGG